MDPYIVNSDSSLIAIHGEGLSGGASILVYLSTTSEIGQIVTIRDIDGFISSPQSILISTTGCTITGESSSIQIQQQFGYITLQSVSTDRWTIINQNSFVDPSSNYTIKGLAAKSVNVSSLSLKNYISSASLIEGTNLYIKTHANYIQSVFTSTLAVNGATASGAPFSLDISGALYNQNNLRLNGAILIDNDLLFTSSILARNNLSTLGNVSISTALSTQMFNFAGSLSTLYTLVVSNIFSADDLVTLSTNTTINRALTCANVHTFSSFVQEVNTSSFYLAPASYHTSRTDIEVVDNTYTGITTPVIEVQQGLYSPYTIASWTTSDRFYTSSLNVTSTIDSLTMTSMALSTANIQNLNGSLEISSITTNALGFVYLRGSIGPVELNNLITDTLITSNLNVKYTIYTPGHIETNELRGSLYSHSTFISSLHTENVSTQSLSVSSLVLTSSINITQLSSLNIQNAYILNNGGSMYTSSMNCGLAYISSLVENVSQINSGNVSLVFDAQLQMPYLNTHSIDSLSGNVNSMRATQIQLGAPLEFSTISPGGLYLTASTISGLSSNTPYEYISGLGTTYSPLEMKASVDRSVYISLGNISSFSTSYINVSMNYRNDGSSNGTAGFRIHNASSYSTLIFFNANPIEGLQKLSLSNYPVDRNFYPVVASYAFGGAHTEPLDDESPNIIIALGESIGVGASIQYSYDSGTTWMSPTKTLFSTRGTSAAWSGEKWVATGSGTNTLAYSYNGLIWYGCGSTIFTEGRCVVYNGSIWVAGGTINGSHTLAYSYDGIAWIGLGAYTFTTETNAIAYNGYMFVAVGSGTNTIAYSYNGTIWNGVGNDIFTGAGTSIAWGRDKWVATGNGTNNIAYSYDGITWAGVSNVLQGGGLTIGWNGSMWIAGGTGTYPLVYSSSGTIWSLVSVPPMTTHRGLTWTGSSWILTGSTGGFATSIDGVTWTLNSGTQFTGSGGFCVTSRLLLEGLTLQSNVLYTTSTDNTLLYSLGGSRWYAVQSLISGIASAILWNGSMWLAGMLSGYDTILYSYDGMVWIGLGQILFANRCNSLSWNGYMWVAVGDAGSNTIGYSYDGLVWTGLGTSIFPVEAIGVSWGNGKFIATGIGPVWVAVSTNGINWVSNSSTLLSRGGKLAFGNNLWVTTGVGSTNLASSSDNGTTWVAAAVQPFSNASYDVAYNGAQWIVCGADVSGNNVAYSSDGLTWTSINVSQVSARGIAWSGSAWFLTGGSPSSSIVYKSINGITWNAVSSTFGPAYTIVSKQLYPYGTQEKIVSIACGTNGVIISSDGIHWNSLSTTLSNPTCVAWNGSMWLLGGTGIAYSTNGVTYTSLSILGMTTIYSIAWSAAEGAVGMWIAVGEGLTNRASSYDGITWTPYTAGTDGFFSGSAYGILGGVNGWIATGVNGMLYSSNGSTWSSIGSSLFTTAYSVYTNGKQLLATGVGTNTLAVSYNGTLWTGLGTSVFSVKASCAAFGQSIWVAVGEGTHTLAVSTDGIIWKGLGTTIFSIRGVSVFYNGQLFIATGEGTHTLATSPDGIYWTGLGTSLLAAGKGVGGKALLPLYRYSVRQPVLYGLKCVGSAGPIDQTLLLKTGVSSAWDSAVYSTEGFTDSVYLTFRVGSLSSECMLGLSETPTSGTTPVMLNYAFSFTNNTATIYESGTQVYSNISFSVNNTFKILYTGSAIEYYMNSTLLKTTNRLVGNPLYMLSIFYTPGATINNLDYHRMYTLTSSSPTPDANSLVASTTPGIDIPLTDPFYLTLTSDLNIGQWHIDLTASGTLSNVPTSLYADIYINTTKYYSTNVLSNLLLTSASTYTLDFNITSSYIYTPGDTLNFQIMGSRGNGDLYIYNTTPSFSSVLRNTTINPNAVEYMEFFHTSFNTGLQTSECSVYLSPVSTHTTSYIDSNYGIEMNRSFVRWNNALNDITIQNRYNDIQTRSLTYTGALYNASDSNLKHSIEYVDPMYYLTAIEALPLRRFSYVPEYRNTFLTHDRTQLGLITSEVAPIFSSMVSCQESFYHCGLSSIQTLDRTQLRYAHLAATQGLIQRVSTLKGRIAALVKAT